MIIFLGRRRWQEAYDKEYSSCFQRVEKGETWRGETDWKERPRQRWWWPGLIHRRNKEGNEFAIYFRNRINRFCWMIWCVDRKKGTMGGERMIWWELKNKELKYRFSIKNLEWMCSPCCQFKAGQSILTRQLISSYKIKTKNTCLNPWPPYYY